VYVWPISLFFGKSIFRSSFSFGLSSVSLVISCKRQRPMSGMHPQTPAFPSSSPPSGPPSPPSKAKFPELAKRSSAVEFVVWEGGGAKCRLLDFTQSDPSPYLWCALWQTQAPPPKAYSFIIYGNIILLYMETRKKFEKRIMNCTGVYEVQARSFRPASFRPTFIGPERRKNWAWKVDLNIIKAQINF
jgi:hypothetical protein